ncbi:MAG: TOMM precursor leader peptide-binding protein [Candidatus Eremiobacteraeota bacterium]|nr:TOMM precursor leader peptide-binding protein [Candidatus Eremiobacteraeota bacterium]
MDFLAQPLRLQPHLRAAPLPDEAGVLVLAETGDRLLEGKVYQDLLPLLDGGHDFAGLVQELSRDYASHQLLQAVVQLKVDSLLVSHESHPYWQAQGLAPAPLAVSLHNLSSQPVEELLRALEAAGVGLDGSLQVVLVDDYLQPEIAALEGTFLLVKPGGVQAWVGPLVEVGRACWHCLAHRLERNREPRCLVAPRPAAPPALPTSLALVYNLVVNRLLHRAATGEGLERLLTFNTATGQSREHTVVKRPQCPHCGQPPGQPRPPRLAGASLSRRLDAEAFFETYGHHVSDLTGLVPHLEPLLSHDLHVFRSTYQRPQLSKSLQQWQSRRTSYAGGKGSTRAQARASALAEALERHSSLWRGEEPHRVASLHDLGQSAIHPNACMLFSQRQFETTPSRPSSPKLRVPRPLDHDQPLRWVQAWSLTQQRWRHLAAGFVHYGYTESDQLYLVGESNGCAAGATLEDAVVQGFFELIERDSVAMWWYNRLVRPELDLAGLDDDYLGRLRRAYDQMDRDFWVLDVTADFAIPACVAVSRRRGPQSDQLTLAFGAHHDPRQAIMRALTEMNQFLPQPLSQAQRPGRGLPQGDELSSYHLQVDDWDYLRPGLERRPWQDLQLPDWPDPLNTIQELVAARDLEMLVVDLTRSDVGLPVARVVVPGMRHHWRRLAPGRLYEVPVALGWLAEPTPEAEVNPVDLNV